VPGRFIFSVVMCATFFGSAAGAAHAASKQDPRVAAYSRLVVANQTKSGNLPGGCATLAGDRVCLPKVALDGKRIPDLTVLNGDVAYAVRHASTRLSAAQTIHVGISSGVFNQLVVAEGPRDGIIVTAAQAKAVAQRDFTYYKKHPGSMQLPAGQTAKQFFLSARTVTTLQRDLIYNGEIKKIQHMYGKGSQIQAFRFWYRQRLLRHHVTIGGKKPTFSLPDLLQ
jgi:hypothetical protein